MADYSTQTVTLYQDYYKKEFGYQSAQILVHEDIHLVFYGVSDYALAKAATQQDYSSVLEASAAFHEELKKHCK